MTNKRRRHLSAIGIFLLFSFYFLPTNAQDTIFLKGDTIRVGELEWDMEKDWRSRGDLISENPELYGDEVKIFLRYHKNKMVEQIVFGYIDEETGFVPHGPARYFYDSGHLLSKRYFKEGYLDGPAVDYYKDGSPLTKAHFKDDLLHGPYRSYYKDGKMDQQGRYEKGEVQGYYRAFYANGTPKWIEYYEKGVKTGADTTYYETGKLESIFEFQDGLEDGKAIFYHRNGTKWTEHRYEEGRLLEVAYVKSKEGRPLEIGSFSEGNGWLNVYNDDGILIEKDLYKGGFVKKVKEIKR